MSLAALRSCKFLYLDEIGEPACNELRLVLLEARVGESEGQRVESPRTVEELLQGTSPIEHGPGCRVFELHWRTLRLAALSVVRKIPDETPVMRVAARER